MVMTPPEARPLVGREAELGVLRGALDAVRTGQGGLVMLGGEAGVGKSRLVEALAEEALAIGVAVRWGRAWEGGTPPAYWPWAQVVSAVATDTSPDVLAHWLGPGAAEVAVVAPDLCARLPGLVPASPSQAPDARVRLHDAVGAFLAAAAAEAGPVVVALDDLHFADDASLRLLAHLAPTLAASPLLVVGTHRPLEPGSRPGMARGLATAARHATTVTLAGLDDAEVARLLSGLVGPAVSARVAPRVRALTDGNPFLALEAGRLLAATGGVGVAAVLPTEPAAVVRRRLGGLGDSARAVLATAAVLGREADVTTLVAVADQQAAAVLDALGEAQRLGLAVEAGLGRWSFAHALVREALLEELNPTEAAEVHRRAVAALEGGESGSRTDVVRLAYHAAAGSDPATAARYCERAGWAALEALAFEEAAEWFGRALERLGEEPDADPGSRVELLLALGEARARAGEFPEARDACRRALALARSVRSAELVARAALGLAPLPESTFDRARVAALEEALAVLPEEDSALRARVLLALATNRAVRHYDQYREQVLGPAHEGLAMARRLADPATLRAVLTDWHFIFDYTPDAVQRALGAATELVELCTAAGDRERLVVARHWLASDQFHLGDLDGARAELERSAVEAAELRLPFLQWGGAHPRVAFELLAGRLDEAERLANEALAIGERSGFADVEAAWETQITEIRYHQGRFAEMLELCQRLLENPSYPIVNLVVPLAHLGQLEEARAELTRAWAPSLANYVALGPLSLVSLVDACWLLEHATGAAELYEKLLPFAGQHLAAGVLLYSLGSADRYLGRLATLLRRFDQAEGHFAAAQRLHEQLGARLWAAHTDADHARMLRARCGPGDKESAAALLARAHQEFAAMGMHAFENLVAAELESLGGGLRGERATLTRDGAVWSFGYQGAVTHVRGTKGIEHLSRLLARPGEAVHALELLGQAVEGTGRGEAERARVAVIRALRTAIDAVAAAHPALGRHLAATLRVGLRSCYQPDSGAPVSWDVEV